jgi:glutathione peroxidase
LPATLEFPVRESHHDKGRFSHPASRGAAHWRLTCVHPSQLPCYRSLLIILRLSPKDPTVLARLMFSISLAAAAALLCVVPRAMISAQTPSKKPTSVLDFKMKDIDGKDVSLTKYQGKVLLLVNTASQCGYTPQYKGLEQLYQNYKDQGLEILAFPANEFGAQEPGTDAQIKQFCSTTYKVSFPLFSKIVVDGKGIHPLYAFLTDRATDPKFSGRIPWNFAKFLVNRKGEVIGRYQPDVKPESAELTAAIEKALAER